MGASVMFLGLYIDAILSATGLFAFLAGLWYGLLFRKCFAPSSPSEKNRLGDIYRRFLGILFVHYIAGLILSFILANAIRFVYAITFLEGFECGFWVWLGLAFPFSLSRLFIEKQPVRVFFIHNGYYILSLTLMGGILTVWRY